MQSRAAVYDLQPSGRTAGRVVASRSEVLSLWLVWTTEKDHPAGFPSWCTDVATFHSFMQHWFPHLLDAAQCADRRALEILLAEDCRP